MSSFTINDLYRGYTAMMLSKAILCLISDCPHEFWSNFFMGLGILGLFSYCNVREEYFRWFTWACSGMGMIFLVRGNQSCYIVNASTVKL